MKIQHPLDKNYTLNYVSPFGDKNLVFTQGRLTNQKYIQLPEEWEKIVDLHHVSVHLTPIRANQNLFVKRIEGTKVLVESNGMPIDCYYLVFGERIDIPRLDTAQTLDSGT
jgi:hypothetical protein